MRTAHRGRSYRMSGVSFSQNYALYWRSEKGTVVQIIPRQDRQEGRESQAVSQAEQQEQRGFLTFLPYTLNASIKMLKEKCQQCSYEKNCKFFNF